MNTSPFIWSSASCTDVGKVRDVNEDSYLELAAKGLWAVADGMGGHAVGDVASQMVIESLAELPAPSSLGSFVEDVRVCLREVNQRLREEATTRHESLIGSTVATLLTYGRHCVYLWAGDSRIYLYRSGQFTQLSRDHSQVEELVASGILTRDQADNHPAANAITRAVGAADHLELEEKMLEIADGDTFVLCSDGLTNEISEDEIAAEIARGGCKQAAEKLVALALSHGARDNVTVVVVHADDLTQTDKTVINPTPL